MDDYSGLVTGTVIVIAVVATVIVSFGRYASARALAHRLYGEEPPIIEEPTPF